mgnify:FL=1
MVDGLDAYWGMKERGRQAAEDGDFQDIHLPRNTALALLLGLLSLIVGFALVWHIWWLAGTALLACIMVLVVRSEDDQQAYCLSADDVARIEAQHRQRAGGA